MKQQSIEKQDRIKKIKDLFGNVQGKFGLRSRLLILFISLLVISTVAVGMTSYLKARELTKDSIESRLVRCLLYTSDAADEG